MQNNHWKYLFILFLLLSIKGRSQDQGVNPIQIIFSSAARRAYLDTITAQTGYTILYSSALSPDKTVGFLPGTYTLNILLDSIFTDQKVTYSLRDSLILLSEITNNSSEPTGSKTTLIGKIVSKGGQPASFATVYFKGSSRGTIANLNGEFRLIVRDNKELDTLVASYIGFNREELAPKDYYSQDYILIELEPIPFKLKGIVIRPENPEDIVMNSYYSRSKNHTTTPLLMNAFFRESSRQDKDFISLTEALVEISKSSYTSQTEDLIHLIKGRNGTNIKESELVNLKLEGGLYNGLRLDIAKYGSYFYGEEAMEYCDFKVGKTIIYNDRQTYMILFDMKPGLHIAGFKGKLYIDAESLALVRSEFEISPSGIKYAKNILVKKTPRGFKAFPVFAKYFVEYRYYDGKWNLYYARNELKIKVKKERGKENKGFSCDFHTSSEFVVTDIVNNPDRRIRYREASSSGDALVEQVRDTDSLFWDNYNIILPEEPLLETISRLQEEGALP